MNKKSFIQDPKIFAILVLGSSSGLPLALTGSTLQAWFTQSGVSLMTIGTLSLLGLPYMWKFLWAPILDCFTLPFLGRRRGWILLTQLGLAGLLLILATLDPISQPLIIGILALSLVFISASQDIVVDAYRTDVLAPEERGLGAAVFTLGYRIAMLVSGGLALIFADYFGWKATYLLMGLIMGMMALVTWRSPDEPFVLAVPQTFKSAVLDPFKQLMQREGIVVILLFIVFYKIGDALALSLMSNFLLSTLNFTLTEVGIAFKTFGLLATLVGAIMAGILLVRMRLFQALLIFGLLQAFSNLLFVVLAVAGKNFSLMITAITVESFCSGMSTAAFVAFIMSLCDKRFSATQYACLSALFALGRIIAGPLAAVMVEAFGWVQFYWWSFALCFPGIFLLLTLRRKVGLANAEAMG